MTLFHATEPIKKCFIPDTPFYDHIWPFKHKMMLYTSESPLLQCPPLYLVMGLVVKMTELNLFWGIISSTGRDLFNSQVVLEVV